MIKKLSCRTFLLVVTLNLILVDSHVILPTSEMDLESENSKFNAFIDNSENSQASNLDNLHNNETSKDSGKSNFGFLKVQVDMLIS